MLRICGRARKLRGDLSKADLAQRRILPGLLKLRKGAAILEEPGLSLVRFSTALHVILKCKIHVVLHVLHDITYKKI